MNDISIYVATHKKMQINLPDIYRFCQVNAEKNGKWNGNYVHDNDGVDNISLKNESYSELTALYELWKNNKSEIKGLCHYRRYLARDNEPTIKNYTLRLFKEDNIYNKVIDKKTIAESLEKYDLILEYPISPCIVNVREDLMRFVFKEDIRIMDDTMLHYYPEYYEAYNRVMDSAFISYLNIMIGKEELVNAYCEWLFDVLKHIEQRTDLTGYDKQHKRIYGYLSEVLLNVYALKHGLSIKYAFTTILDERNPTLISYIKQIAKNVLNKYLFNSNSTNRETFKVIQSISNTIPYSSLETKCGEYVSINNIHKYYEQINNSSIIYLSEISFSPQKHFVFLIKYPYGLSYTQSNARCVAVLETDSVDELMSFEKKVTDMFESDYTINLRVLTENREVIDYCNNRMIYVYKL